MEREKLLEDLERDGELLAMVSEADRDREMCLVAVGSCGMALRDVPLEVLDDEICLAAVRECGMALPWVPEGMRTEEICLAAGSSLARDLAARPELEGAMFRKGLLAAVPEEFRDDVSGILGKAEETFSPGM